MKKFKILCIGSEGLAKQALPAINNTRFNNNSITGINCEYWFFDDVNEDPNSYDHNLITTTDQLDELCNQSFFDYFVILIGAPEHRRGFSEYLSAFNIKPLSVISDKSEVFGDYGDGCIMLSQSLIEHSATIGKQVLMNVGSKVFHDASVGDYSELMPGCLILGNAKIGSKCRIGANATILPNISICDNAVIGARAVVTKNILYKGTYVGVPATIL